VRRCWCTVPRALRRTLRAAPRRTWFLVAATSPASHWSCARCPRLNFLCLPALCVRFAFTLLPIASPACSSPLSITVLTLYRHSRTTPRTCCAAFLALLACYRCTLHPLPPDAFMPLLPLPFTTACLCALYLPGCYLSLVHLACRTLVTRTGSHTRLIRALAPADLVRALAWEGGAAEGSTLHLCHLPRFLPPATSAYSSPLLPYTPPALPAFHLWMPAYRLSAYTPSPPPCHFPCRTAYQYTPAACRYYTILPYSRLPRLPHTGSYNIPTTFLPCHYLTHGLVSDRHVVLHPAFPLPTPPSLPCLPSALRYTCSSPVILYHIAILPRLARVHLCRYRRISAYPRSPSFMPPGLHHTATYLYRCCGSGGLPVYAAYRLVSPTHAHWLDTTRLFAGYHPPFLLRFRFTWFFAHAFSRAAPYTRTLVQFGWLPFYIPLLHLSLRMRVF